MRTTGPRTLTRQQPVGLGTLVEQAPQEVRPSRRSRRRRLTRDALHLVAGPRALPTASALHLVSAEPAVLTSSVLQLVPDYDAATATGTINGMVVRAYYERAINGRNPQVMLATHAETWVGHFRLGSSSDLRTRATNMRRVEEMLGELPDLHIALDEVRVVRDLVIVRFTVTGHGEPAVAGFAVHRMVRGRIVDEHVVNPVLASYATDLAHRIEGERRCGAGAHRGFSSAHTELPLVNKG